MFKKHIYIDRQLSLLPAIKKLEIFRNVIKTFFDFKFRRNMPRVVLITWWIDGRFTLGIWTLSYEKLFYF